MIEEGSVWDYKGKRYTVIMTELKVKDPDSGVWHDGIMYEPQDLSTVATYVRQLDDFKRKFKAVSDD